MGDGAWEGCVPEGSVWAMGTPPGTMPSNAPGMPPGATPTTPGGYLGKKGGQRLVVKRRGWLALNIQFSDKASDTTGSFLPQELEKCL